MQLIGQQTNLDIINKWSKLPNFLIIQGDKHTGKKYFVLYLCQKFGLFYKDIKPTVKNIRELLSIMVPNSNTVYHLQDFEDASLAAKNALLKITEEPIPGNYIVITGGPQLKTLESRARKIIMSPYSLQEIQEYVNLQFSTEQLINLYKAGINTPAKIKQYKDYEELQETLDLSYKVFDSITTISPQGIISLMSKFEDRYDKGVDKCMLFLDMLISIIETNIKEKSSYSFINYLKILTKYKSNLHKEPTLRRKMIIYRIFYEFYNLRSDIQGVL